MCGNRAVSGGLRRGRPGCSQYPVLPTFRPTAVRRHAGRPHRGYGARGRFGARPLRLGGDRTIAATGLLYAASLFVNEV